MKCRDVKISIAIKVSNLREQRGYNQRELAKRAGVSQKTISNLENTESLTDTCNLDKLMAVADALGVELSYLINTDQQGELVTHQKPDVDDLLPEALEFARLLQELPAEQRVILITTAKAFMDSTQKQTGKVA